MRFLVVAASDVAARRVAPGGVSVVSVQPGPDETFTVPQSIGSEALSATAWAGVWVLVLRGLDHVPLPRGLVSVLVGGLIGLIDHVGVPMPTSAAILSGTRAAAAQATKPPTPAVSEE